MQFLCLINGTPANVKTENMKFRVDGDECAIVGSWHNGKPYRPNREQFRAALPYRWRAAFDREQAFWHSKEGGAEQCKISLSDARGRYLATIYCQPVQELLNPQEVFDSFWAVALQDAQMSEDDNACTDDREPEQFEGEPNAEYGARYRAACEAICAKAEPILAALDLNRFPRGMGESSLSDIFGSDLYMTSHGHGVGFWDGDWGDAGDALTELAKAMPSGDLAGHRDGGYFFL